MEKEWLISQQKNAAGTSEKASELAAQLDQTKTELREEKTKVKMIVMMMMVVILVMMMMMEVLSLTPSPERKRSFFVFWCITN